MGGLEKLQTAVLHKRNVATGKLHFKQVTVMGRAKQNRLPMQGDTRFSVGHHTLDNIIHLLGLIVDSGQNRLLK